MLCLSCEKAKSPAKSVTCTQCDQNTPLPLLRTNRVIQTILSGGNLDALVQPAAVCGDVLSIRLLIENNADIKQTDHSYMSPIDHAALKGHTEVVKLLLDAGVPLSSDKSGPLLWAVRGQHLELVQLLLDLGADPNSVWLGILPIFHAVRCESSDRLGKLLLDRGARFDVFDSDSCNLLHHVAHASLMAHLLHLRLNHRDRCQRTPLFYHCERGRADCAKMLLDGGARVDLVDEQGKSALHVASTPQVVQLLIKARAPVDLADESGSTPLHDSCRRGNPEIVRQLVQSGAHLDARESDGIAPLHIAVFNRNLEEHENIALIRLLVELGASLEVRDSEGLTPLLMACSLKSRNLVHCLLELGADKFATDERGHDARWHCVKSGLPRSDLAEFIDSFSR